MGSAPPLLGAERAPQGFLADAGLTPPAAAAAAPDTGLMLVPVQAGCSRRHTHIHREGRAVQDRKGQAAAGGNQQGLVNAREGCSSVSLLSLVSTAHVATKSRCSCVLVCAVSLPAAAVVGPVRKKIALTLSCCCPLWLHLPPPHPHPHTHTHSHAPVMVRSGVLRASAAWASGPGVTSLGSGVGLRLRIWSSAAHARQLGAGAAQRLRSAVLCKAPATEPLLLRLTGLVRHTWCLCARRMLLPGMHAHLMGRQLLPD